jgi:LysM repeat protein
MGKITHQQAHNMIQTSVDHPLTPKRQARLDAHVTECGDCRRYAGHLRKLENDLRRVMQEHWHEQQTNISIKIIQARSRRLRRRNTIWNTVKVLGEIALLATLLIVVNSFLRQLGSSSVTASQTHQESATRENASPSPLSEFQATHIEYVVQQGDTLLKISSFFNVSVISIVEANNLKSGNFVLYPGQTLIISIAPGEFQRTPTSLEPSKTPALYFVQNAFCAATSVYPLSGTRTFIWPSQNHYISGDNFSEDHPGLDIAGAVGDLVSATDSGVTVFAGWNPDGYGNLVIIDHVDGWYSLYAHLARIDVTCGQNVLQSTEIGTIGNTGNTTAPNLYFAVVYRTWFVDPLTVLPQP